MPVNGVPQSVRGRVFDVQFTLQGENPDSRAWKAEWKNKGGRIIEDILSVTFPIEVDNDVLVCRGIGDVFEDCADNDIQPPKFPSEIRDFITKFKVRLIPLDEADLVINSLFYGPHIRDPDDVFLRTLFEYTEDTDYPLWAGIYWHHKKPTQHDENGLPVAKDLVLTSLSEDNDTVELVGTEQPYDIWLDAWDSAGHPEITREFTFPAIIIVRDRA